MMSLRTGSALLLALLLVLALAACRGGGGGAATAVAPAPARAPASSPSPPAAATASDVPSSLAAFEDLPGLDLLEAATPAVPASPAEAVAAARAEYELVAPALAAGTSKVYSRSDFLPLDDPRAMSTGDFVGRLRALFGEVPDDEYVLRHRATGLVVTAYSAQSGPSYGGSHPPEAEEARNARVRSVSNPREGLGEPLQAMSPEELLAYRKADHAYKRAMMDALAHPTTARLVQRLDALVSAVPPVDWQATRYWGEDPTVYVEGVEDGEAFSEEMEPADGLAYLLDRAERRRAGLLDASQGLGDPDLQLVAYWGYHMRSIQSAGARPQLERERARVQRAWFRLVDRAHRLEEPTREYLLGLAELHAPPLRLDPPTAAAALRGSSR